MDSLTTLASTTSLSGPDPKPKGVPWQYDPGFSRVVTVLAAGVFCACAGWVSFLLWTSEGLDRIALPERALSLMVGRTMDVEEAVKQAPDWEYTLYQWLSSGSASERAEAIAWYEELADRTVDPTVHVQLAILRAEAGQLEKVERQAMAWAMRAPPYPTFAKALQGAYFQAPIDPDTAMHLQAEIADLLPAGWFYDRLAIRLAEGSHDTSLLASLEMAAHKRAGRLFTWFRWFSFMELGTVLLGTGILLYAWRRRDPGFLRYGAATQPPVWPGESGPVCC